MPNAPASGSFDELIATATTPVLVDFTATWCGPCQILAPSLDHLAKDFSGSLTVVKVDVDRRPTIAARFGIQGVPTLILFRDGQAVWRRSGVIPYPELASEVRKHINA